MRHLILVAVVLSSVYLANAKCCARGIWSAWAPSGECSDTCGSCGKITYIRKCISARNGCPCSGTVRKTKNCNIMPCKYPRDSCCGKMDAIVKGGKVICGPQPSDSKEAPGPAPGTPCTASPPPPPRPRTTKRITKATTKPTTTDWTRGPGGPSSEKPTPTTPSPPCPAGWSYCPGASQCYKWIDGEYTQPEAQSQCRELGGSLATIDSSAATQCLLDYAAKSSQEATSAWIGLVDTKENSNHTADCTCWKWLDGSPYKYENFGPGQPNNGDGKEWCTEIFLPASDYPAGMWNDELCDATRPAVCSVPANVNSGISRPVGKTTPAAGGPTPATRVSTLGAGEPTTSAASKPSTRRVSPTTAVTSKPSSPRTGPTTAVPTSPTTGIITTPSATTATSSCPSGWFYCPAASRCYKLIDGEYTQPEAQSQCRKLGGSLASVGSTAATQCLIDYAAKSSQEPTSAWIGLVDTKENSNHTADCTCWKWLDGSTYNYENFGPGQPNNGDGKEWCTEIFLPASDYPAGTWNDELCDATRSAVCSVPANGNSGISRPAGKTTTAAGDSTPATRVSTRAAGEPTTSAASKMSTPPAVRTTAGTSKPSSPQSSPTSAVPTPPTTDIITTPTATTTRPACPGGWAYCPAASRCYKLIDGGFTQSQAQSQCRAVGGNLAAIDSDKATQCVLDYTAQTAPNATRAWIGLVDPTENSKHTSSCTCWTWLDGSPYNYETFLPREPNNNGGKEWCTVVDLRQPSASAGTWLDWGCDGLSKPALCSMPANGSNDPHRTTGGSTRAAIKTTTSGAQAVGKLE